MPRPRDLSPEDSVGQLLWIGFEGTALTPNLERLLRRARPGGVILFSRNIEDARQVRSLTDALYRSLPIPPFIAVDQEGGRVNRLRPILGPTPASSWLASLPGPAAAVKTHALATITALKSLGFNVNFAPVLDLSGPDQKNGIGDRAFGDDPRRVVDLASIALRVHLRAGVIPVGKHFPGLGSARADTHRTLPVIRRSRPLLWRRDLLPYRRLKRFLPIIMVGHAYYPALQGRRPLPATLARTVVEGLLRKRIGHQGLILTDDLEMGAIGETCPIGEAVVKTSAAGHDLLLVCHTEPAQRAAARALLDAYRAGTLPPKELEASVERVRRLRERRATRFEGGPPAQEPDAGPLARAIATRSVTIVAPGRPDLRRALNGRVGVVFPRFSDLAPRITIEPEIASETAYIADAFGRAGVAPTTSLVGIEPTDAEIAAAAALAEASDAMVLFLFDAHLYASNKRLLSELQARARALAVVLMRDPYDAALLSPGVLGITAYGFRKCQLDAVIGRLLHS